MYSDGLTDEFWAPLRDAVPSFATDWDRFRQSAGYDVEAPGFNLTRLTRHLAQRVRDGERDELAWFGAALERIVGSVIGNDDLLTFLRLDVLESLIMYAEEFDVAMSVIYAALGPRTREQWPPAYRWMTGHDWPPAAAS